MAKPCQSTLAETLRKGGREREREKNREDERRNSAEMGEGEIAPI